MKYYLQDVLTAELNNEYNNLSDAIEDLKWSIEDDIKNGNYEKDYYVIVDEDGNVVLSQDECEKL